jgi:hypothetical protein
MKKLAILALLVTSAFAGPVSHFGALKVCGNNICGEKTGTSTPIFFKGPSLFWSAGLAAPFYSADVVDWFVDNMQIGVIRAAMGIQYYRENAEPLNQPGATKGYFYDQATQKKMMRTVIDAAILNDIYVVIDWHSHNAHSGTEPDLAKTFFTEMANEYEGVPNIIWELYNEPIGATTTQVTSYANGIITALRNAGNNNLVLIGSPNYSIDPKGQAGNFSNNNSDNAVSKNVAFTFHFYSDDAHKIDGSRGIGTSAKGARTDGYAVFGSEWGISQSSGNGNPITSNSDEWTKWMDDNKVSNCMWSVSSIDESSAMFTNGTSPQAIATNKFTKSGEYFETYMGKNKWTAQIPDNHPKGKDVTVSVKDGEAVTLNASTLDLTGEIVGYDNVPFGEVSISDDKKSITYKTADRGSVSDKVQFIYKVKQGDVTIQSKIVVKITDRRPILPEKAAISVSRRAKKYLNITGDLSATDPSGSGVELTEVSISPSSAGTVSITPQFKDSIVFTPAESLRDAEPTEATLNYTVKAKSGSGSNSASVVLNIQNLAPTITLINNTTCCRLTNMPNTEPVGIGIGNFNGKDGDDDSLWFEHLYLDPQYPGTLEKVKADSFVYHPEAGKIGKVVFLALVTDGNSFSNVGRANLTLTGNGTEINVTAPTEIPGVAPIIPRYASSGALGLRSLGFGMVELSFAQSGSAKLDVYSLSGKNMGTLLNGWQNAGSSELSLKSLNLQKGVYILRLRQGSQVKTMRIVN